MCPMLQISSNESENDVTDVLIEENANINEDEEGIIMFSFSLIFALFSSIWFLPLFSCISRL